MSNITEFQGASVPAFLKQTAAAAAAADLTTGVSASYAVISIKGKTWAIVKSKERKVILDKEREPVRSINVVLVKGNPTVSKVFYADGYVEGSDDKPTCYSNDNIAPAADAEEPQSKKCATCPHNQWGSAISRETGVAGKGKACADSRRLAVAPADLKGEPMLLRVPPASLKNVADYARMLADKNVPYFGVVTKLSFDPDAASPKVTLKFVQFLDEAQFQKVQELADSDLVDQIIAKGPVPMGEGTTAAERQERFDDHDNARKAPASAAANQEPEPAPTPRPRARKAAAPAPAPAPEPVAEDPPFDSGFAADPEPESGAAEVRTAAAKPASAAPAAAVTTNDASLDADLADALSGFDD